MNYELAKQLKDAGFSQEYEAFCNVFLDKEKGEGYFILNPILSDLIKACADKFMGVYPDPIFGSTGVGRFGGKYYASSAPPLYLRVGGKTKEEAVANLWLILKKNGNINN